MRILILSDSLALPREKPEECRFEDTWPILLRKEGYEIHQVSIGGGTSTDLVKQIPYHINFNPDIVFVQVGIVDCAPRFAKKEEINFLRKQGILGYKILTHLNNKKIRKLRNITYIPLNLFRDNINKINNSFNSPVYFLGIIPAHLEYEKVVPGITKNIKTYNNILKERKFVSLENIPKEGIMSDYHHLNKIGHKFIFNLLPSVSVRDI